MLEIIHVKMQRGTHLMQIAGAVDSLGGSFGLRERRQQHRRENRDDGNDDQ
jgi:hypothetical protein